MSWLCVELLVAVALASCQRTKRIKEGKPNWPRHNNSGSRLLDRSRRLECAMQITAGRQRMVGSAYFLCLLLLRQSVIIVVLVWLSGKCSGATCARQRHGVIDLDTEQCHTHARTQSTHTLPGRTTAESHRAHESHRHCFFKHVVQHRSLVSFLWMTLCYLP